MKVKLKGKGNVTANANATPPPMVRQRVLNCDDSNPDDSGDIIPLSALQFEGTTKVYIDMPTDANFLTFAKLEKDADGVNIICPARPIKKYEGMFFAIEGQCRKLEFVNNMNRKCRKIHELLISAIVIVPRNYDSRILPIKLPEEVALKKEEAPKKKVKLVAKKEVEKEVPKLKKKIKKKAKTSTKPKTAKKKAAKKAASKPVVKKATKKKVTQTKAKTKKTEKKVRRKRKLT